MYIIKIIFLTYFLSLEFDFIIALSSFIKNFDTLNYEPNIRVRRMASYYSHNNRRTIKFQAFKKNFQLNVFDDYSILHPDTELVVENMIRRIGGMVPVRGYVENHPNSDVFGTIVDGVFRGKINLDINNDTNGAYYVEHYGYHFKEDPGFHSIIYHDSDVNISNPDFSSKGGVSYCGLSHPDISHNMYPYSSNHGLYNYSHKETQFRRKKRSATTKGAEFVCNLYLQSDTFLWDKVMSLPHVKRQNHLAVQEISSIFTQHVQGAQAIYQNTLFQTFGGHGKSFNGIGFRVDRVRINTTADCEPPLRDRNPFCSQNIDVTHFLNLNSYMRHDDFCLAYVFTYRDFSGGTLGLAWVAEPGGSGGVCEKNRLMQEAGWSVQKSLNTGIVTLLNYGSYVALKVSQLTFAHEVGHNFGSKHDDDHKDHRDCVPSIDDPKGNYIMFASATSGEKENNNKFSSCSKDSIARLLDRVTSSNNNCFLNEKGSFCGNKLTEEGEECDCGYTINDCTDKCCHPKISKASCKLTDSVKISYKDTKVLCSPSAGECCTKDCQFESDKRLCRSSGECYKAAYCTGGATKCPPSEMSPNLTRCHDNTRVCKNGECVGSVCESVPGWQECSIVRDEGVTAEMLCFVACKSNLPGATCISTFKLQENPKLQEKYRNLVRDLMPDRKAIQLKAGAPCDNYHGYCDAFLRCRSVEADGPLARIKGLLFSSQMLQKVKIWTTQFWWAVMLICIGGIIFVGIFLKVCSKSTPSMDPNIVPRAHRPRERRGHRRSHRRGHRSHRHQRSRHHGDSRHRSETANLSAAVTATSTTPDSEEVTIFQPLTEAPPRPPQIRNRPRSMVQSSSREPEDVVRPMSMNVDSNIEMISPPGYPPPAYEVRLNLPPRHGHGRRKRGNRHALNHQTTRNN